MKRQLWNSLRWLIYIIDSVYKPKLPCYTPPLTQHHSFFRNLPPLFIDILASAIDEVLNHSICESTVPHVWKLANVPPLPKAPPIEDFNKDLRPISLTSTLSKVAEGFVIDREVKSLIPECMDPNQFGFIPYSYTTFALMSMMRHWLEATDGNGAYVRAALLDCKKAFYLEDHDLLIANLYSLGVKSTVVNWIIDFLRGSSQRVKLSSDCVSDFTPVPTGIRQGTRIGPWLLFVMVNDLATSSKPLSGIWKFADDTTVSEIVPKSGATEIQDTVDHVLQWSNDNKFKLNLLKCKEFRIDFRRKPNEFTVIEAYGNLSKPLNQQKY